MSLLVGARFFDWQVVLQLFIKRGILQAAYILTHLLKFINENENDNMTNSAAMKSIVTLLSLIESKDWQNFEKVALSSPTIFRTLCEDIAGCEQFHGMTLLHAVARFDPPLTIVAKMIVCCPDLASATDCLGRTPLHVAAGLGASPDVIKLIAHSWPAACISPDEDGKTPLHLACDSSCELFEDDFSNKSPSRASPNHDSIRNLLSECLHAATMEDLDEMSPLEYAILSDAEMDTVKLLQLATSVEIQS